MRRNGSGRQNADPFHVLIIESIRFVRVNSVTHQLKVAHTCLLKTTLHPLFLLNETPLIPTNDDATERRLTNLAG